MHDETRKRREARKHDEIYKKLFAFPRVVEDLLRGFVAGPWLDQVDFSTLEKLSTEYVSDELLKLHGDAVWGMRRRKGDHRVHVVVLLEFQSQADPSMALRIHNYTGLLYRELVRSRKAPPGGPLPYVLPIVLYNGKEPWRATGQMRRLIVKAPPAPELEPNQPRQRYVVVDLRNVVKQTLPKDNLTSLMAHIEQMRTVADYEYAARSLRVLLGHEEANAELRRAFVDWLQEMLDRLPPEGEKAPRVNTLEEVEMSIVDRVAEWPKQWKQEGIEEGVVQGLAQQRALLARLAQQRFGEETAGRVADALEQTADPERLAEAGEAIVQCASGDELVERVTRAAAPTDAS